MDFGTTITHSADTILGWLTEIIEKSPHLGKLVTYSLK